MYGGGGGRGVILLLDIRHNVTSSTLLKQLEMSQDNPVHIKYSSTSWTKV